jgi:hypothetical protein
LDTEEIKYFTKSYKFSELQEFFTGLIRKYSVWARFTAEWEELRNTSIKALTFPFAEYRKGQGYPILK